MSAKNFSTHESLHETPDSLTFDLIDWTQHSSTANQQSHSWHWDAGVAGSTRNSNDCSWGLDWQYWQNSDTDPWESQRFSGDSVMIMNHDPIYRLPQKQTAQDSGYYSRSAGRGGLFDRLKDLDSLQSDVTSVQDSAVGRPESLRDILPKPSAKLAPRIGLTSSSSRPADETEMISPPKRRHKRKFTFEEKQDMLRKRKMGVCSSCKKRKVKVRAKEGRRECAFVTLTLMDSAAMSRFGVQWQVRSQK